MNKIICKAHSLLKVKKVIVRDLASFIRLIINVFYAVKEAPLFYRNMERNQILGLKPNCCYDNMVYLTECSRDEILWWINNIKSKNGKDIRPLKATEHCVTDASLDGWGAIDLNINNVSQGRWSSAEKIKSINF